MGTLQLSFEQYSPSVRQLIQTRKNGTSWAESSPRPLASPWPRPLLALLSSTTSTAASTPETRTPDSPLTSSTSPTWTPPRSTETSTPKSQSTPSGSVSAAPSRDSAFPPESPRNSVLVLRSLSPLPSRGWKVTWLVPTTP